MSCVSKAIVDEQAIAFIDQGDFKTATVSLPGPTNEPMIRAGVSNQQPAALTADTHL
jgi:hypothetical protein